MIVLQGDAARSHHDDIRVDFIRHITDHEGGLALPLDHLASDAGLLKTGLGLLQQAGHLAWIVLIGLHHRQQHQLTVVLLHQLQRHCCRFPRLAAAIDGEKNAGKHGKQRGVGLPQTGQ